MKKLDVTSLKKSVTIYIAVAMTSLILLTMIATSLVQKYRAQMQEENFNKQIHLGIEHVIKHYIREYSYRVHRMIETEDTRTLLKNRDRDGLYKIFRPKFDIMVSQEKNLKIMHFHLPDGTSLLRVHKPKHNGDNLLSIRPMIKEVHSSQKIIHGYETGKHSTVYRVITPIFAKSGEYLGAFEIGLNPKFILNTVREINGFNGMMFIKEQNLELFSRPNDRVISGYRLQSELSPELEKVYDKLHINGKLEDDMKISTENKKYKAHLFILKNYEDEERIKIIFFQDTTSFGIYREYLLLMVLISVIPILAILTWLIYRRIGSYQKRVSDIYEDQISKLYESEHRFALLYEKAPEAYQSLDEDGNLIIVNAKWTEELGYESEEVIGKNFGDFLAPDFIQLYKETFSKFISTGIVSGVEFDMVKKDGLVITISLNGKVVRDDNGKFLQTHCIFTNVTKHKKMQYELEFNQDYLQSVFDVIPSIMITTDGIEIDRVNPQMLEFFGYETIEEFKKEHNCVCDYYIGDNDCLVAEIDGIHWLQYILERENELHKVCMNRGSKRYHFIVQAHALEIDEKKRSVVVFSDITDLEDLGSRLEYAIKGSSDGLWDWNMVTDELFFAPKWKEMLGYRDDELENNFKTWEERVHPDDLEMALEEIEKSHTSSSHEYNFVHRLRHKDGHWVWILDRGQTIFNEDGKAVRMIGFHTDITEQKEREAKIKELGNLVSNTINSVENLIFVKDSEFRYLECNSAFEELMDAPRDKILGKDDYDFFDKEVADFFRDKDKEMLKSGKTQQNFEWVTYPDGREVYFFTSKSPLFDSDGQVIGLVGNSVDMTEQKRLEKQLLASQHQFEQFMEFLPANIMIKDESLRLIYANNNANNFFKRDSIVGMTAEELLPPEVAETVKTYDTKILEKGINEELIEVFDDENNKLIFRNLGFRIEGEEGVEIGIVSVNITEEYKLKKSLHEQEELMIAQSRHAAMGEMISMIAHQWRQPISVIAMDANNILADIELEMIEEDTLKGTSEDIIKQTQELSKTIDDFRNFFRPETGTQEVIVKELFDDALSVIGKSLGNNQIEFILELDESKKVTTYTRELMQVFINIIKNAKEALIENEIKDKKITVYTSEDKENFKLRICDNAGGVNAEIIDKIFNPYFTTKGEKNGTGLGLYMSRTIVEKHLQGSLTIKNNDEGACFEIIIPHVIKET